jgi:hypothetical protein
MRIITDYIATMATLKTKREKYRYKQHLILKKVATLTTNMANITQNEII